MPIPPDNNCSLCALSTLLLGCHAFASQANYEEVRHKLTEAQLELLGTAQRNVANYLVRIKGYVPTEGHVQLLNKVLNGEAWSSLLEDYKEAMGALHFVEEPAFFLFGDDQELVPSSITLSDLEEKQEERLNEAKGIANELASFPQKCNEAANLLAGIKQAYTTRKACILAVLNSKPLLDFVRFFALVTLCENKTMTWKWYDKGRRGVSAKA